MPGRCMALPFSTTLGIQWTPPAAPANSGNSTLAVQGRVNVPSSGAIDVPAATVAATVFPVPFGSVSKPLFFAVKNLMSSDIGIRFNGSSDNNFKLAPGGFVVLAMPAATDDESLTQCSIVTTDVPDALEVIQWWCFGD